MNSIRTSTPNIPLGKERGRNLPLSAPLDWLVLGWKDIVKMPSTSLVFGFGVAGLCSFGVLGMLTLGWDHVLFPALSGLLIVGPALATGLYEKSRCLAKGETITLGKMLRPPEGSGKHVLFVGAILAMLMLLWVRAAVLLFALFWGWRPFPSLDEVIAILLTTPMGWGLLGVGTAVGGLFAAFAFAISAFSIPMLLDRKLDGFTAMGLSMSYVWRNLPVMLVWGAIVLFGALASLLTGFLAFVLVFPMLGHATWHGYSAICSQDR